MKSEPKSKSDHSDKHSLDAFREPRLYPRFWDMSEVSASTGNGANSHRTGSAAWEEDRSASEETHTDKVAFDDWQLSRHYPGEDSSHDHTFTAY